MPDAGDIADDIASSALKPQSATVDGNSVNQMSISDKIKAAQFTAGQAAANNPLTLIKFFKLVPPGGG